ncbi:MULTISPECIES: hypothetical protein [unclassified Providencia]|uniref:hypothetical protein n=1 Tax=unclassified Providencia TaxID=2633465 RepID=UPI00234A1FB8|nr:MULTISPECIES: hypothetical protein [unclassified Providencia]
MTLENNQGGELILVIRKYIDIEWNRTSRRFVKKYIDPTNFIDGELYVADTINELPSTIFRPIDERNHQDFIAILKAAVESYHGKIDWVLAGRQKTNTPEYNWGVEPAILRDPRVIDESKKLSLTTKKYLAEQMPELGPVAYADLINLAKHVDKYLEKHYLPLKRHS